MSIFTIYDNFTLTLSVQSLVGSSLLVLCDLLDSMQNYFERSKGIDLNKLASSLSLEIKLTRKQITKIFKDDQD